MALFGMAYATAPLGCTVAPFLAIVVSAFRSGSTGQGIILFAAYAAGMGLIVGVASLTLALTRSTAVGHLRRAGALAPRIAGGLLLVVGLYVAYYGWYEIRVQRGPATTDPVIDGAGAVQRALAGTLDSAGPAVIAGLLGILLLTARVIRRLRARHSSRTRTGPTSASGHTD
jgi:hypothetical protein